MNNGVQMLTGGVKSLTRAVSGINDGSVVWKLCKYDEAATLEGTSLNELTDIMIGIVTGYETKSGSLYVGSSVTQIQIPIPSGADVNRCVFSITDTTYTYNAWVDMVGDADGRYPEIRESKTTVRTEHIDQSTGIIHFPQRTWGNKTAYDDDGYNGQTCDRRFSIPYMIRVYG